MFDRSDYAAAVDLIRSRTELVPRAGIVLGSGLGPLADALEDATAIPYADIPRFPVSTVHGHSGQLIIGRLEGVPVVVQRGRAHFYEGYTPQQVVFPVRVMHYLGTRELLLTNAAGGVNKSFRVGDIMVLNDHINFVGLAGHNPLIGPNDDSLGLRFPGLSQTYDRALRAAAVEIAASRNIPAHQGVYAGVSGPFFETPAEIRMIRVLGGDAVGMSTVHEAVAARHAGMRVFAMSGITNECIDTVDSAQEANHEEVLEAGATIVPRMEAIIRGVLRILR